MNMSKTMNQSFKGPNKLEESRAYEKDRSRILYEIPYNQQMDMEKCDKENLNIPSCVAVYAKEIFEYLIETQVYFLLNLTNI